MTAKPARPAGRHALDEEPEVAEVEEEPQPDCNVSRCARVPEWRGLCPAHRQTHRGLADPRAAS